MSRHAQPAQCTSVSQPLFSDQCPPTCITGNLVLASCALCGNNIRPNVTFCRLQAYTDAAVKYKKNIANFCKKFAKKPLQTFASFCNIYFILHQRVLYTPVRCALYGDEHTA